ncbi:MAG: RNA polymerase sigma factor [Planctomycetes bacterium]|nr:RNA polymerase sigma factor [Planctomycetota bacterium]NOG54777.1 RNA polymerase sigma factor [Planctomycetota bacterium]
MTRHEEQELIVRAKAGDSVAISDLIKAHQDSLYAFMLRLTGRPEVAEDVVQEAFVRVLKNLDRFDPKYRFSTWLFTIAKRLNVNWSQKFHPVSETDYVQSCQGPGRSPLAQAASSEARRQVITMLDRALSGLGKIQREIILLFHQQDWSISEIAEYLDMPEGTIKSHLHRARRKMRHAMEEQARAQRTARLGFHVDKNKKKDVLPAGTSSCDIAVSSVQDSTVENATSSTAEPNDDDDVDGAGGGRSRLESILADAWPI